MFRWNPLKPDGHLKDDHLGSLLGPAVSNQAPQSTLCRFAQSMWKHEKLEPFLKLRALHSRNLMDQVASMPVQHTTTAPGRWKGPCVNCPASIFLQDSLLEITGGSVGLDVETQRSYKDGPGKGEDERKHWKKERTLIGLFPFCQLCQLSAEVKEDTDLKTKCKALARSKADSMFGLPFRCMVTMVVGIFDKTCFASMRASFAEFLLFISVRRLVSWRECSNLHVQEATDEVIPTFMPPEDRTRRMFHQFQRLRSSSNGTIM